MIVDDHTMVRTAVCTWIKTIPEMDLVGEAVNGFEAIEKAKLYKPEVILMDLIMPKMDGIEATRAIKKELPDTRILIVTSFTEIGRVIESVRAGASGFILKDAPLNELMDAILAVANGKSWISKELAVVLTDEEHNPYNGWLAEETPKYSEEDIRILNHLVKGLSE